MQLVRRSYQKGEKNLSFGFDSMDRDIHGSTELMEALKTSNAT